MVRVFKHITYASIIMVLAYISINRLIFLVPGNLEFFASSLAYPFLVIQRVIITPINQQIHAYRSYNELKKLIAYYKQENEHLQSQVIELKGISSYAQETKDLRIFAQRYATEKAVLAQILLKNFDEQNHFLLIDAGSRAGITADMVVVYKNCLIGKISEVYPFYSKVILITDKRCKVAAYCASTGVQAIHEGDNNIAATRLSFVNHLETVTLKDLVLSSGEGLVFPRGFALGHISSYETDGFSCSIAVKPLVDVKAITYCFIIQKGTELIKEQTKALTLESPIIDTSILQQGSHTLESLEHITKAVRNVERNDFQPLDIPL